METQACLIQLLVRLVESPTSDSSNLQVFRFCPLPCLSSFYSLLTQFLLLPSLCLFLWIVPPESSLKDSGVLSYFLSIILVCSPLNFYFLPICHRFSSSSPSPSVCTSLGTRRWQQEVDKVLTSSRISSERVMAKRTGEEEEEGDEMRSESQSDSVSQLSLTHVLMFPSLQTTLHWLHFQDNHI